MLIATNQVSSVMLRLKKSEIKIRKNVKTERADKNQTESHEINQIRRRMSLSSYQPSLQLSVVHAMEIARIF